jgi:hypothetical protein
MTREEIIRLAEKVYGEVSWNEAAIAHLETVVNLAVAAEREACAKVCDAKAKRNFNWGSEHADKYHAQADWAEGIAAAIRARGK